MSDARVVYPPTWRLVRVVRLIGLVLALFAPVFWLTVGCGNSLVFDMVFFEAYSTLHFLSAPNAHSMLIVAAIAAQLVILVRPEPSAVVYRSNVTWEVLIIAGALALNALQYHVALDRLPPESARSLLVGWDLLTIALIFGFRTTTVFDAPGKRVTRWFIVPRTIPYDALKGVGFVREKVHIQTDSQHYDATDVFLALVPKQGEPMRLNSGSPEIQELRTLQDKLHRLTKVPLLAE